MLLFIQIALLISAWKRGWKAWALLPVAITFGIGVMVGMQSGTAGPTDGSTGLLIGLDLLLAAVLGVMAYVGRKPAESAVDYRPAATARAIPDYADPESELEKAA